VLYIIKFNLEENEISICTWNETNLIIIELDNINVLQKLPNTLATRTQMSFQNTLTEAYNNCFSKYTTIK